MAIRPGYYDDLQFNAPLSDARADAIAIALAARQPGRVLDIGCGWAELLLRIVAAAPSAIGIGVDQDEPLLDRGRANAAQRGIAERVQLIASDGSLPLDPGDVVVCIGSDHVFGDQAAALAALAPLVNPGGVLLFGTGYWQQPPTPEQAGAFGATPDELFDLAGLVERTLEAGFRPLDIQTANEDEWNAFESGYLRDWESWLMHNAAAADAGEVRAKADTHRGEWLRGYRNVLGFAYLTLGLPLIH
jgi:cyclopropane fatty-acyl-phospholipid synthase-like methyltransferase